MGRLGGLGIFQCNLKKNFIRRLRRLVFPMLFGPSDGPPHWGGGGLQGVGDYRGGGALGRISEQLSSRQTHSSSALSLVACRNTFCWWLRSWGHLQTHLLWRPWGKQWPGRYVTSYPSQR